MAEENTATSKTSLIKSNMSKSKQGSVATEGAILSLIKERRSFVKETKADLSDIRDLLNVDQLSVLKDKFYAALDNVMTREEFLTALKDISGLDFDEKEFNILFLKMNEKCNGILTWDEYLSYLLLSYQAKGMIENIYEPRFLKYPISQRPKLVRSRHPHAIIGLCFASNIDPGCIGLPLQGVYFTVSSEGVVNRWTIDMDFIKSNLADCTKRTGKVPIECIVVESLPDVNILAIATSNKELHFYDTTGGGLTAKIIITQWEYNITTMYFYSRRLVELYRSYRSRIPQTPLVPEDTQCMMLVGDVGGNIYSLNFSSFNNGPFQKRTGTMLVKISFKAVAKGKLPCMSVTEYTAHHLGPVQQVYYHHGLNSIFSCCDSRKRSMMIMRIHDKNINVYYGEEPVICFAIDEYEQTLAGGTKDGYLYVWNVFVPYKRTAFFKGHNQAIIKVVLQNKSSRMYSIDVNRIIKVWNIRDGNCLQTLNKIPASLGERTFLHIHYNPGMRILVMASLQIVFLECDRKPSELNTHGLTHIKSVSAVLYNQLFKSVVTCGCDSSIIAWDLVTGVKQMVIVNAHTKVTNNEEIPVEITAATFHPEFHLLLTGANDGSIKIWNWNSGFCLKTMSIGNYEVTYLLWMNNRILAGSWNSCMSEFDDSSLNSGATPKVWEKRHQEYISSADHRAGLVMVTVTYGSEMVLWNMDTSSGKRQYILANPKKTLDMCVAKKAQANDKNLPLIPSDMKPISQSKLPKLVQSISAHCVLFLKTRPINAQTGNFVISLGDGTVQVWSEHPAGGYLTSFTAVHSVGDYVTKIISDEENQYLITGTACGYIKIWLLTNYHTSEKVHICMPKLRLQFPFLWKDRVEGRAKRFCRKQPLPLLLSSYRAHMKAVTALVYIAENNYVLSGSGNSTVRIWSLGGQYLNTLGTFIMPWKMEPKMPPDVHKVASSTTLKVWNNGQVSRYVPKFGENQTQITSSESSFLDTILEKIPTPEFLRKICKLPKHPPAVPTLILDDSMPKIPVYTYLNIPDVGTLPVLGQTPDCILRSRRRKDVKEKKVYFAE